MPGSADIRSGVDFRFRRGNRLLDGHSFQNVFDAADYKAGDAVFLFLARENQGSAHRLGLIVGKKKVRRAVDRALVKRLIRESFRLRPEQLAGLDVVVLVRGNLRQPDGKTLRAQLDLLWDKLLAKRRQA